MPAVPANLLERLLEVKRFNCPHCKDAQQIGSELLTRYGSQPFIEKALVCLLLHIIPQYNKSLIIMRASQLREEFSSFPSFHVHCWIYHVCALGMLYCTRLLLGTSCRHRMKVIAQQPIKFVDGTGKGQTSPPASKPPITDWQGCTTV